MPGLTFGMGLGFLVAAQVGPIWLLCAKSVLRQGLWIGLTIGAGAALIDMFYAAMGEIGAAEVLHMGIVRTMFGVVGAGVLIYLGSKSIWVAFRVRQGLDTIADVITAKAAFRTALVATAANPMTIAAWGAIFTAALTAHISRNPVWMVLGVGMGSVAWFALLSTVMALIRHHVPAKGIAWVDVLSGLGLIGFGMLLGWRTLSYPAPHATNQ